MYVEDALSELGYAVASVARNLAEALALARESQFDFTALDINSNGEKSFPVWDEAFPSRWAAAE